MITVPVYHDTGASELKEQLRHQFSLQSKQWGNPERFRESAWRDRNSWRFVWQWDPRKRSPSSRRIGPYKGSMTSFRHGVMTQFTSRCHRRRSEHSNRHRRLREWKPHITKGRGRSCWVRWDLVTRASTKRSAGDTGFYDTPWHIFKSHNWSYDGNAQKFVSCSK